MMASYAAALIEELQHKVGDVERAARACLEQGSWTPNSTESSTRELHNYLQQLQYLLDRLEGYLRDQHDIGNARNHKLEILGAISAANVASTALAAIQTFGCNPEKRADAFSTAWLQFTRLEVTVTRLPALVHQYFNAQQCEDMPAGLSLYGNLAEPLPQHMAAIKQSLVNDHAMYLEEVYQRLASLLTPRAADALHKSLEDVRQQFMMAVEGSQARAAAPVQHTWATQTELSYLSDAASFATWGAKDAATQTDVKHQSAAVQTVSMGTHMECQTDLPQMGRRVASASSLPSLSYLLAPTPGSPESAIMVSQACQTDQEAGQPADASMQTDSAPIALPARFEDYSSAGQGLNASSQTQAFPALAGLNAVTQTEQHPGLFGSRSAPTTPAAGSASAGTQAIHDMWRSVGSMQEPDAPSTPRLGGANSHLHASLADMMSFDDLPHQPALHITSHLMYPEGHSSDDAEACDMLPCWERGPVTTWPASHAAREPEPVNMHLLRGFLSDDEACQPLIAPACTPSASVCLDPTHPEQHWAVQEPFVWDLEFSPFEPFLHANGPHNARSCAHQPTLTVALRHGQDDLDQQQQQQETVADEAQQAGVRSHSATWETLAREAMEILAVEQPEVNILMQPECESDSDADTEDTYEFVEHDEPMANA